MSIVEAVDPPTCRICADDEITDQSGRLFRPCACKTSYVHEACLARWRATSADSFYRCEVCHYAYRTSRQRWAAVLLHPVFVGATTVAVVGLSLAGAAQVVQLGARGLGRGAGLEPFNLVLASGALVGAAAWTPRIWRGEAGTGLRLLFRICLRNSQRNDATDFKMLGVGLAVSGFAMFVTGVYGGVHNGVRNTLGRLHDRVLEVALA
jgi:hypothetical protein